MDELNKRREELDLLSKKIEAMNADLSQVPDDASIDVLLACRQKAYDLLTRYAETAKDIAKLEKEIKGKNFVDSIETELEDEFETPEEAYENAM